MSRAVTEEEMTQGISRLEAHTAQIMEEAKARGIAVGVVDGREGSFMRNTLVTGMRKRSFPLTGILFSEWHL